MHEHHLGRLGPRPRAVQEHRQGADQLGAVLAVVVLQRPQQPGPEGLARLGRRNREQQPDGAELGASTRRTPPPSRAASRRAWRACATARLSPATVQPVPGLPARRRLPAGRPAAAGGTARPAACSPRTPAPPPSRSPARARRRRAPGHPDPAHPLRAPGPGHRLPAEHADQGTGQQVLQQHAGGRGGLPGVRGRTGRHHPGGPSAPGAASTTAAKGPAVGRPQRRSAAAISVLGPLRRPAGPARARRGRPTGGWPRWPSSWRAR